MTDTQLYVAVGIPSILVILAWFSNSKRMDSFDKRMDSFVMRLDRTDGKIDNLLQAVHADTLRILEQITSLHERIAVVETKQGK